MGSFAVGEDEGAAGRQCSEGHAHFLFHQAPPLSCIIQPELKASGCYKLTCGGLGELL